MGRRANGIRPETLGLLLVSGLLVALCAAAVAPVPMNHDAAWYLHMAAVWLDGGTLYRDVIDTNPPLIVFLTAAPVQLARLLSASEPLIFKLFVFALAGLTTVVAIRLIRRTWDSETTRFLMTTMLVFLVFPFVRADFGQREHFTVLMVIPYVLTTCAFAIDRRVASLADVSAGVLAGLGFAMKPHFLLGWLALEICLVLMRPRPRSWLRPAVMGVASAILLYALAVIFLVPDYWTVARDATQVYGGLNSSSASLLRLGDLQLWMVSLLALVLLRLPLAQRAPCLLLFAVATGLLLAAMLQLKGWGYHLYPFRVMVLLFFTAAVGGIADGHPAALDVIRGGKRMLNAAVVAAVAILSTRYVPEAWHPVSSNYVTPLVALIQQRGAESMALLSMRNFVYPAFPVVNYTRIKWVLRHNSVWFLPGLYVSELRPGDGNAAFRAIEAMGRLERQFYEQMVDDFCANPPRLIVVEPPVSQPTGPRTLDLVRYYRQDPRFDRLFASYVPVATILPFVVYSRSDAATCADPPSEAPAASLVAFDRQSLPAER